LKLRLKIDNKETGKQCAAISTGLVIGALAQLLLEPERIQPVLLTIATIGAFVWYALV